MRSILSRLRLAPKRFYALLAIMTAVVAIPAMLNAWGPTRQTFTIEKPATYVEFNSITNNPNIGDERNFVGIREKGTTGLWQDKVKAQPGKEYVVRMYVHNNAAENLNLMARDVNAMFYLPNTSAKSHQVNGFLRSSNAKTKEIYDHATFTGDENFKIAYVDGSIKYYNNANGNGFNIPDSLFTSAGAKLGYKKMDGNIPGCFQYAGYLTFTVRPQFPDKPKSNFTIKKEVRKEGGTFSKTAAVNPGDTVNYRLTFTNTGETTLKNVILKDTLPKGVTYVPGSVQILNAANPGGAYVKDGDKMFSTGVNIGSYTAGSNALVVFNAKVKAKSELECGKKTLKNVVSAQPEGLQPKTDDADVTTDIDCPVEPVYTCDALTVQKIERTKFKFDTKYTVKNATFKSVTYIVKDANGNEVYRGNNAEYTQTKVGKYTVEAHVTVTVNGKDVTVTADKCKASFEVAPVPVTPKPGVKIEKTVNGVKDTVVNVDEPFIYTLVVTNTGNVDLKNVKVTDNAPEGVTFQSADKGTVTDKTWTHTIDELKTGKSETFKITAIVKEYIEGKLKNTACVNAPEVNPSNPDVNDDCDDATVSVPKPVTPPVKPTPRPTPTTPTELPQTGAADTILNALGLGALVTATIAYVASRRNSLIG